MEKHKKRIVDGMVEAICREFRMASPRRLHRVMESGGVGLGIGTDDARLYEFLWQHRHEVFTQAYYPIFCQNDKIHS